MQYCVYNIELYSIISHICNGVLFLLWLCLFVLSGVISPLFSSNILHTYQPAEFIFQCPIFLPFHTVHGVLKQEYWSGLPFPSPVDHILSDISTMTHPSGVATMAWLSFIELDKAVVCVIRLAGFLWLWFQTVCPLRPLSAPTILLGFLLPWTWGMSSRLLQQSAAAAPDLGRGVAPPGLYSMVGPF